MSTNGYVQPLHTSHKWSLQLLLTWLSFTLPKCILLLFCKLIHTESLDKIRFTVVFRYKHYMLITESYQHRAHIKLTQTEVDENALMTHRLPADDFIIGSTFSSEPILISVRLIFSVTNTQRARRKWKQKWLLYLLICQFSFCIGRKCSICRISSWHF